MGVKYILCSTNRRIQTKVSLKIIRSSNWNNKILIKITYLEVNTQQKLTKV